jgi:hypothetical protein
MPLVSKIGRRALVNPLTAETRIEAAYPPPQPIPKSLDDLDLPAIFLAQLLLKQCFYLDVFNLKDLGNRLKLPTNVISQLVEYLIREKYVESRGGDPFELKGNAMGLTVLTHRYALTEGGKKRAAQLIEEALLLSVALVALSLLVGGIESILKQTANYTSSIWSTITSSLSNIFGSFFHW